MAKTPFMERMQAIDRRWIYLLIALSVVVPFAFRIKIAQIANPEVEQVYNQVERLESGSRVLLSFDFDPGSEAELLPMAVALTRHMALRGCKIYFMALWPQGQDEITGVVDTYLRREFPEYVQGEDYVNLGYRPGSISVIKVIEDSFAAMFRADVDNTPLARIPVMNGVNSLDDLDFIISISAGFPGAVEWVQLGGDPTGVPVAAGTTAVQSPLLYPYYPDQLIGLLGGIKAAAEYETLLLDQYSEKYPNPDAANFVAIPRMGPQTIAHVVIMLLIIVGNVAFFLTKRGGGARLKSVQS